MSQGDLQQDRDRDRGQGLGQGDRDADAGWGAALVPGNMGSIVVSACSRGVCTYLGSSLVAAGPGRQAGSRQFGPCGWLLHPKSKTAACGGLAW